jgi:predicted ester cyclase
MRTTSILILFALSFSVVALADAPSPQAQNKSVVLKFEDQFKNKANHDIVDELTMPTYQAHGIGPAPLDRAGMKQLGKAIVTAFPDVHVTIDSVVAEGDLVVTRCSVAGTHKGPFQGIPATGRAIRFTEMHMYRLAQSKIVEQWSNIDVLAILAQLGAFPPPRK